MATVDTSTYTQTIVTEPTKPSTESMFDLDIMAPLLREIVADGIIDEPKLSQDLDSARSFFTGQSIIKSDFLLSNLKFGQQVRVNIEKDQNPLSLFQKSEIEYKSIDACHDQIDLDCTVPCINTLPTFQNLIFRFDTEYAYGVRACDKNKDFWEFDFFTKQYALSKRAEQFGRELDLWNTVIKGLIAAPATTVDAKLATVHPTHYWSNQGTVTANGRALITEANWYLKTNFVDVNPTVFMTDEAAHELIRSVENPYNLNRSQNVVNTFVDWNVHEAQPMAHRWWFWFWCRFPHFPVPTLERRYFQAVCRYPRSTRRLPVRKGWLPPRNQPIRLRQVDPRYDRYRIRRLWYHLPSLRSHH